MCVALWFIDDRKPRIRTGVVLNRDHAHEHSFAKCSIACQPVKFHKDEAAEITLEDAVSSTTVNSTANTVNRAKIFIGGLHLDTDEG